MICPDCQSTKIFNEDGYDTIFRCYGCGKVGNKVEFREE